MFTLVNTHTMTKTVSARIDSDEYDKVLDLANEEGLTVNEFLGDLISSSIENSPDSNDSNDDDEEEN